MRLCIVCFPSVVDLIIAGYCEQHHVKLILVVMPMYEPEVYGNLDKLMEYHANYLKGVELINYSNFRLPDESYYADVDHLNYKGTDVFSNYLQNNFANDLKMQAGKE